MAITESDQNVLREMFMEMASDLLEKASRKWNAD